MLQDISYLSSLIILYIASIILSILFLLMSLLLFLLLSILKLKKQRKALLQKITKRTIKKSFNYKEIITSIVLQVN